ncbi:MAG: hypothetical protein ACKVZJ_03770 [Phycisphaerales bacterium]
MPQRNRWIQIVCLVLAAAALLVCGPLSVALTAEAGRAEMVYTDQAQEGDPPEVALGIAMGAFRGLFVNYLWLRATKLKEEGKFYEAIELSQAITRLQPRFPRVWAFHAWNMSYNISVATNTASERWTWVKAGVDLLRKEAIPRNPNDVLLYKELAWIFNHKIQSFSDDANRFYKRRMAEEWTFVLGVPPSMPEDSQEARKLMVEWLRPVAEAPERLQDVIEKEIADQRAKLRPGDPEPEGGFTSKVEALVTMLLEEGNLKLDETLLRFYTLADVYDSSWYSQKNIFRLADSSRNSVVDRLRADAAFKDAWDRLIPHIRKRVLIDEKNMDPARMARYTTKFGPLDWRHASSHAIYWSAHGVEEMLERSRTEEFDTLNTDRIIVQGLQELFRSGRIFYDPVLDSYNALLDTNWADSYGDVVEELAKRGGVAERAGKAYTLYGAGYENFLRDVIRVYYRMGEYDQAQKYMQRLITWEGNNINDPDKWVEYQLPLGEFVKKQLANDRLSVPHVAAGEVASALMDAFYNGLLRNNLRRFAAGFKYAEEVHKLYYEEKQTVRTTPDRENRMEEMPTNLGDMAAQVLISMMAMGDMDPTQAATIYTKAPAEIQRYAYDQLRAIMLRRGMPENSVNSLYPEPPGMVAFRAARAAERTGGDAAQKEQLRIEQK